MAVDKMEKKLEQGTVFKRESQFDKALESFKFAILLCPCNKHVQEQAASLGFSPHDLPLPVCHCTDYLLQLPGDDEAPSFNQAIGPCSCGSGIKACNNQTHIDTLCRFVEVYEGQRDYQTAIQYASSLIKMTPLAPEGYLTMARLVRLIGRSSTTKCKNKNENLANFLYIKGNHVIRSHGDPNGKHSKLSKNLRSIIRIDIVACVPREVALMILGHLSDKDLSCRTMRVSKIWKATSCDPALWRKLSIGRIRGIGPRPRSSPALKPLPRGVLNNLVLQRSKGFATSLTINGLWALGIKASQIGAALKALPQLKTLDISGFELRWGPWSTKDQTFPQVWEVICRYAPSTLANISLSMFPRDASANGDQGAFQQKWLADSKLCNSLKSLSLVAMGPKEVELVLVGTLCRNIFSKLETLSLVDGGYVGVSQPRPHISLTGLIRCTPELKDLTLHTRLSFFHAANKPDFIQGIDFMTVLPAPTILATTIIASPTSPTWCYLRRLASRGMGYLGCWPILPLPSTVRFLDVKDMGNFQALVTSLNIHGPHYNSTAPQGLEHFRCRLPDAGNAFVQIQQRGEPLRFLKPSIANGSLRSLHFHIEFCLLEAFDRIFTGQKGVLNTLSCEGITYWTGAWKGTVEWMATFPNLQVAGLFTDEVKAQNVPIWLIITHFMKLRPDVKTIYTNILYGAARDEVLARAAKLGVTIIHATELPEPELQFPPPPPWVKPIEEDDEDKEETQGNEASAESSVVTG